MKIEDIIYDTARGVLNVEDKLRIATIFLFCKKLGFEKLSELLYAKNHPAFVRKLNTEYADFDVDFHINFSNPNIKAAFYSTLEKVKERWDNNGFLKAISERDPFALVICDIVKIDFATARIELKRERSQAENQLQMWQ